MFEDLINRVLPGLSGSIQNALLNQLKAVGKKFAVDYIAKSFAHALLKSIDTIIAISVANLSSESAEKLAGAYATEVLTQIEQFGDAVSAYIPLQVAVEVAKQQHGANSAQANAARKRRTAGIAEMRQEVRDLLRSATGQAPVD